ncbi:MAG: FABP family protein [Parafilimonas sp.]
MKETFLNIKKLFAGKWVGEGFAKYPTIDDTFYTEHLEFLPDEYKDSIFYNQKTWYKNDTEKNGHTVFWDVGFIILKEEKILLHSVQVGGRMEIFELVNAGKNSFTFNSISILEDPKATRSQRIFTVDESNFHYELNMATHAADFQNHLKAGLNRSNF